MGEEGYPSGDVHLALARALSGEVWSLLGKPKRTTDDDYRMIHAAHASCYHWLHAGSELQQQRGEWLIARVYAVLNAAGAAMRHALRCHTLTENHDDLMRDFDRAYAYEALARAHAVAYNAPKAAEFKQLALSAGKAIARPQDREIFQNDFESGDWCGVD